MKYRSQRYATRFPVTCKVGLKSCPGEINSISQTGARVAVGETLPTGADVTLSYSGGRMTGQVSWCNGSQIGIVFKRQLSLPELERIRFGVRSFHPQMAHRVGFREMR